MTENGTKRLTWEAWLPPGAPHPGDDELLTRDELIERVKELGTPVTTNQLRYWENVGAFPRPVRRFWPTAGAVSALYPLWAAVLVPRLDEMRRDGVPWDEIGRDLRARVPAAVSLTVADEGAIGSSDVAHVVKIPVADATIVAASAIGDLAYAERIAPALKAYARRYAAITGRAVATIEVRLADETGATLIEHILTPQ